MVIELSIYWEFGLEPIIMPMGDIDRDVLTELDEALPELDYEVFETMEHDDVFYTMWAMKDESGKWNFLDNLPVECEPVAVDGELF